MGGVAPGQALKALPYYEEILNLLRTGESPLAVAKWIQETKGGRKDIQLGSLERQLYRLRNSLPASQVKEILPKSVQRRLREYDVDVNELEMLAKLWQIQMERIIQGRDLEVRFGTLNKGMYREIEKATDILVKIGDLKIKLGHYEGAATERFAMSGGVEHVQRIESLNEAARERLGSVAHRLLEAFARSDKAEEIPAPESIIEEAQWELADGEDDPDA